MAMRVRSCSRTSCSEADRLRSCRFISRRFSSARRRWVMSRSTAVNWGLPSIRVCEIVDSIGNSVPSERSPVISMFVAMARDSPSVHMNRSMCRT